MKKLKLTPWISPVVKPVHAGVYEFELLPYPFHYWDGCEWLCIAEKHPRYITPNKIAEAGPLHVAYLRLYKWRGLAHKPAPKGVK